MNESMLFGCCLKFSTVISNVMQYNVFILGFYRVKGVSK